MHWYHLLPLVAAATASASACDAGEKEYDYIVVGSGPGGGPLAANLARAGYSTLLLEAGDDQHANPNVSIITNFNLAGNDPATRWDFFVRHSDDPAQALKYKRLTWRNPDGSFYVGLDPPEGAEQLGIYYPRAGTLGGCSQHNAGIVFLPYDDDWNLVVNLTGDTSWEAPKMRKLFERLENNRFLPRGTPGHGFDGWLDTIDTPRDFVEQESDGREIALAFANRLNISTANLSEALGRDINGIEPNRDEEVGFYSFVWHADEFQNRSSPNSYVRATLEDAEDFPLTLKLESLVTKILFDEAADTPTAIGVEVMEGRHMYSADPNYKKDVKGKVIQYRAKKEVIISGGVFNSPQILKLSGIGPAAELTKFGIPVVKDLPGVGENMADNYEAGVMSLKQGEPLTGGGFQTLMLRTPSAVDERRNIFAWCGSFSFEGFWPGFPEDYGPQQFECALVHMNPKSQAGYVRLRSADPQDVPDINTNFFAQGGDQDLTEMLDAIEFLRDGVHENTGPWEELHPCPGVNSTCSDDEQKEYIHDQVYSHHATSTCRIGADDDPMAVLDSKFRVRGVKNLRVVDASSFPVVPGAFPVVPTMMLAEKASDDIIGDAGGAAEAN
ncbi:hypothetical protein MCOR25_007012 [Pyricularia grisea]|nr:hypothetical protein MCOR25_007012 [Pyricularia grisea]